MGSLITGGIYGEKVGYIYAKYLWFESVGSGTSGTLTPPPYGEIVLDQWSSGVDAIASTEASGLPEFVSPKTAGGTVITATLDASGNWTLSGTPSSYPIDIVYVYRCLANNFNPDYSLIPLGLEIIGAAGSGDVVGPSTSVDSNLVEFNSTTGKIIKDSGLSHLSVAAAVAATHLRYHSLTSTSDHVSTATPGQILKADASGLPVNATNTDLQVSAAVTASHARSHAITSASDHTSTANTGQMLKADANGLPVDASNTDTEVSSAVSLKHDRSHSITSTSDHSSAATPGKLLKADSSGLPVDASNTDTEVSGHLISNHVTTFNTRTGAVTPQSGDYSASDVGLGNVLNVEQLPASYLDTDNTLAGDSDAKVSSQKAIKHYVDDHTAGTYVTSFNSRTGDVNPTTNDYTWAEIDKTTSSLADITTKSHTALSDIGTNTHAQIDTALTRLASTSGSNTGDQDLSGYVAKSGSITQITTRSHTDLTDIGTNTHAQVDSHISSNHVTTFNSRAGAVSPATNDYTWAQINKATSSIADITTRSHTSLADIGTNTHAQVDTHIASTSNPHSTTKTHVGLGNVDNVQQMPISYLDTDEDLTANSDTKVASQKATKSYVDSVIATAGGLAYKGDIDCSANPNYPAADNGDFYIVSAAGKIGGASGKDVDVGDWVLCNADSTASGDEATVGTYWDVVPFPITIDTDVTLADNSDAKVSSQKATKTYVDAQRVDAEFYVDGTISIKPHCQYTIIGDLDLSADAEISLGENAELIPFDPIVDHTDLLNIGTNTHSQIDTDLTRLASTSGTNTGDQDLSGYALKSGSLTQITTRSHTDLTDIGTNTHAQIDTALTRLASTSGSNTGDQDLSGYVAKSGSITQIATRSHTDLTDIGTNTHAQIDTALTRLANTSGTNTGDQDLSGYTPLSYLDTDGTLAANSDIKVASQKATKTYADTKTTLTAVKADSDISDAISKKHVAVTVSGNGISLSGQQVSLSIGTGSTQVAAGDKGVTNGNSHDHNGGDGAQISHLTLSNIGTNTHAQIDTFISSKAAASGLASLNSSSLVVQNPANATAMPTGSKIPIADVFGKIDEWVRPQNTQGMVNKLKVKIDSGYLYVVESTSNSKATASTPITIAIPDGSTITNREDIGDYLSGDRSFSSSITGTWGLSYSTTEIRTCYLYAIYDGSGIVYALSRYSGFNTVPTTTTRTHPYYFWLEHSSSYTRSASHYCVCIAKLHLLHSPYISPYYTFLEPSVITWNPKSDYSLQYYLESDVTSASDYEAYASTTVMQTGLYYISGSVMGNHTGGYFHSIIKTGSATYADATQRAEAISSATPYGSVSLNTIINLNSGDTIHFLYIATGDSGNRIIYADGTYFNFQRIG